MNVFPQGGVGGLATGQLPTQTEWGDLASFVDADLAGARFMQQGKMGSWGPYSPGGPKQVNRAG